MALQWWQKSFQNWDQFKTELGRRGINPKAWSAKWPSAARIIGSPFATAAPNSPGTTTNTTDSSSGTAAAAPVGSPVIPGVGVYGMLQNQAQLAYEQSLAGINQRQQDILQQYGFQGQVDPKTGALSNVAEDPSSVYGVLPSLRHAHGKAYEAEEGFQATRNIGTGGLAAQGEEELAHRGGADFASAFANYRNAMQGAQADRIGAQGELSNTNLAIQLGAAQSAIENEQFTPADLSSIFNQTSSTTTTPGAPGAAGTQGGLKNATGPFKWGGKLMTTKADMTKFLVARGAKDATLFRLKHPDLWKRLK